jgi:hypothetical protein
MATLCDLGQRLMAQNLAVQKVVAAINDVLQFVVKVQKTSAWLKSLWSVW